MSFGTVFQCIFMLSNKKIKIICIPYLRVTWYWLIQKFRVQWQRQPMLEVLLMKYEEWPSPIYKDILELQCTQNNFKEVKSTDLRNEIINLLQYILFPVKLIKH